MGCSSALMVLPKVDIIMISWNNIKWIVINLKYCDMLSCNIDRIGLTALANKETLGKFSKGYTLLIMFKERKTVYILR